MAEEGDTDRGGAHHRARVPALVRLAEVGAERADRVDGERVCGGGLGLARLGLALAVGGGRGGECLCLCHGGAGGTESLLRHFIQLASTVWRRIVPPEVLFAAVEIAEVQLPVASPAAHLARKNPGGFAPALGLIDS